MRIAFKFLAPIILVLMGVVAAILYMRAEISQAQAEQELAETEASTLAYSVWTAHAAWRDAIFDAAANDAGSFDADFNAQMKIVRSNVRLVKALMSESTSQAALGADKLAALDRWERLVRDGAPVAEVKAAQRRVSAVFDSFALPAIERAESLRASAAQKVASRVKTALLALFALGGLALAFGALLLRTVIAPLRCLVQQADAVADAKDMISFAPSPRRDEIGQLSSALSRMMTRLDEKTRAIEKMAFHDPDTGLPNRTRLLAYVAASAPRQQTLVLIKIEEWERTRTIFGSPAASEAAVLITSRLSETLVEAAPNIGRRLMLARLEPSLYGCIIVDGSTAGEPTTRAIAAMRSAFEAPFKVDERPMRFTPRFAVASTIETGTDGDTLVNAAMLAMDTRTAERGASRDAPAVYSLELRENSLARRETEERLRAALAAGQLQLHYQPLLDACTGAPKAAEALLRWPAGVGLFASPAQFIPIAEESGLIADIDDWVAREVCKAGRRWRDAGLDIVASANVSALRFQQQGFGEHVADALLAAGLPASSLKLEITETAVMADPEKARETLAPLKKLGVQLAMDDFGTGYSNLATLARLPFDVLKIDRSLAPNGASDREAAEIVRGIVRLARQIQLKTVIEGIESDWQARFCADISADLVQGYHFCRPLPEPEFLDFMLARMRAQAAATSQAG